jgi:hypothetical protein
MMYSIRDDGHVIRASDGATIPPVEDNRDYQEYLAWVSAGNSPTRVHKLVADDNTFGESPWLS